jgi:cell wall-associated NlpC family hydrolase
MSLAEVQARTAELQQRLQELTGSRTARGALGGGAAPTTRTAATDGASFAQQLRAAGATAADGATGGTASGSTAAGRALAALASVPASSPRTGAATAASTPTGTTGEDVVATAKRHLGVKYVWGGESLAEGGFDCSGLMQWAYRQHGVDLPRVSRDQAKAGREVSASEARPGDLVFFDRKTIDHIGMYAGGGKWVVAPKTGDVVKVQDVDLSKASTIRRVLPDSAAGAVSARASAPADLAAALPAAGRPYAGQIAAAARAAGIDPALLAAVAWTESGFDPSARSKAGAVGLVQLMPRTAQGLGVTDRTDPAQSLRGGATYLKQQLAAFDGRTDLALAAYNAGPTAVRRSGGVPPYEETQRYVEKVLSRVRTLGGGA